MVLTPDTTLQQVADQLQIPLESVYLLIIPKQIGGVIKQGYGYSPAATGFRPINPPKEL
jgi:hypothetical protein